MKKFLYTPGMFFEIPEFQRPYSWQNPHVRLKDDTTSQGKHVLIDGQQRITALRAAILGKEVMNNKYKYEKIGGFDTTLTRDEIEKAKQTISDVPPKSPFEEKYENPKMTSSLNWENCNKVLDEFIKVDHFKKSWH